MKLVGRRFMTWVSVAFLSFFVKGEVTPFPQEKANGQVTNGTTTTKHNVPLKTNRIILQDKRKFNSVTPDIITEKRGIGKVSSGLKTDAGSKDASKKPKRHFFTRHK